MKLANFSGKFANLLEFDLFTVFFSIKNYKIDSVAIFAHITKHIIMMIELIMINDINYHEIRS